MEFTHVIDWYSEWTLMHTDNLRRSTGLLTFTQAKCSSKILTLEYLTTYQFCVPTFISTLHPTSFPPHLPLLAGHTIYSTAAPSGGPLLLFILNTLETYPLFPANSTYNLTYHRLIEIFKYGFALRTQLGDPNCAECENIKELVIATQENMTRWSN